MSSAVADALAYAAAPPASAAVKTAAVEQRVILVSGLRLRAPGYDPK
jgi:hypothetical protein